MTTPSFSILLDSEALSASVHARGVTLPWLVAARRSDSILYISAVTLAEVVDGGARDATIRRALNAMRILPVTDAIGYTAGRLRRTAASARRKARDPTVDVVVAATALTLPGPAVVLTGDPGDLRLLLADTGVRVAHLGA